MTRRQIFIFCAGIIACVVVAWALVAFVSQHRPTRVAQGGAVMITPAAQIGGPFTLTDHTGKRVSDTDFRGRYMLIYFGYTFCPDVCPTELQTIARAMEILGDDGKNIVPVFISVDPARDTVAAVKDYVAAFHPRMVGLTGSKADVEAAAKAYKVYARKAPGTEDGANDYLVDHTSHIYLVGPDGKVAALFKGGTRPETLAKELERLTE
ncbi:MAG TPA: SCO family protein [Alphaproteobacteria bacterium]|nr:SCO family protein [Alphaproteobacteria bacterium]